MAGGSDGSIVYRVTLSSKELDAELSRIKKKMLRTQEDITTGKATKDALTKNLAEAENKLDELRAKEKDLSDSDFDAKYAGYIKSVDRILTDLEKQDQKIKQSETALDGLKNRYSEVAAQAENAATASGDMQSQVGEVSQAASEIPSFFQQMKSQITDGFSLENGKQTFSEFFSWLGSRIKSIPKAIIGGIGSALKSIGNLAKRGAQGILSLAKKALPSFSKSVGGVENSFKRLIPAMLGMRGVIGILRKAVSAYMQQNQQLSNTLSGAWTGLGNILGPVIDRIVNLTASAIAYVTKFLNLLGFTGKATAKQMSSAGGAAKKETDKLKKQIMSFDELNILNDEEEDSTGGGGGADTAGIVPDVTLPDWLKIMSDQIKSAQWAEAATTLTTALNGMVDSVDWSGIGEKIGNALNGAMTFIATALKTFDWKNLGAKLADGFNNISYNVDWQNLGVILWGKFKIILEALAGFIGNVDMAAFANAASNIAIGLFNSITETLNTIDWQTIGTQIAVFIENVDWAGVSDALFRGLGAALASLVEFLVGIIGNAWDSVVEWWYDTAYEDGQFTMSGLLEGIWEKIKGIGAWIKEHIFNPFIDGFKNAFGIHSPSTVMSEQGGYIIDGLLNGIRSAWTSVKDWIGNALSDIRKAFADAWTAVKTTAENIWNGIVSSIKGAVNGVIGVINRMIAAVTNGINGLFRLLSFNIDLPGGHSIGLSLPQFTAPQIPYLAQGAVIPPNAPFAAVLGDQRHGNNIEAPEDLIRKIVREEAGNAAGEWILNVSFDGDLAQLIRLLAPKITAQQKKTERALGV